MSIWLDNEFFYSFFNHRHRFFFFFIKQAKNENNICSYRVNHTHTPCFFLLSFFFTSFFSILFFSYLTTKTNEFSSIKVLNIRMDEKTNQSQWWLEPEIYLKNSFKMDKSNRIHLFLARKSEIFDSWPRNFFLFIRHLCHFRNFFQLLMVIIRKHLKITRNKDQFYLMILCVCVLQVAFNVVQELTDWLSELVEKNQENW